jgi:hypothetical protein
MRVRTWMYAAAAVLVVAAALRIASTATDTRPGPIIGPGTQPGPLATATDTSRRSAVSPESTAVALLSPGSRDSAVIEREKRDWITTRAGLDAIREIGTVVAARPDYDVALQSRVSDAASARSGVHVARLRTVRDALISGGVRPERVRVRETTLPSPASGNVVMELSVGKP